ncbi:MULTISPECIES: Lrp/AsnC family transcriptional regulator [Devosia]|uniref:Leucine-responsive regulatory protein n=1 Tax=Devosia equisanguinis TaxID=2490941 RepID=A0A447I6X1_9HYPH|nr:MULTISPECIES: Lrp/AsnC family transcriptional regulator [Devosia]VDS03215.1 Leucine-responsive regulatory protein [Devosia equisanguinis]
MIWGEAPTLTEEMMRNLNSKSRVSAGAEGANLDSFDRAILNVVQENNQLTSSEIGDRVGLSSTACLRRLSRLRQTGIIKADVAIVDPAVGGARVTLIVQVSLEREQASLLEQFKKTMIAQPEVVQCYYVTGAHDFVLIVNVRDMAGYDEFTQEHFFNNPNVRQFSTSVVMREVKFSTRIML